MNRPTRNTLLGAVLCGFLGLCYGCKAKATGLTDFDLACAVASAAEVVSTTDEEARAMALHVHWFYLGRLSGRDDATSWTTVVTGRLAEMKDEARSQAVYGNCLVFAGKKIN